MSAELTGATEAVYFCYECHCRFPERGEPIDKFCVNCGEPYDEELDIVGWFHPNDAKIIRGN